MRVSVLLLLLPLAASADYVDPWLSHCGTDTLPLVTAEAIANGEDVSAFDFNLGEVASQSSYTDHCRDGIADLFFIDSAPGSGTLYFRSPEDSLGYDRSLMGWIYPLQVLEDVATMEDADLRIQMPAGTVPCYVMLVIDTAAAIETTAVKFTATEVTDSTVTFDWAWQPNGSREFIPTSQESASFSEVKSLYSR